MAAVRVVETAGRGDVEVRGVQYDSRRVGAGDVFVAMRGGTTDGNDFIDAAIAQGAAAVVTDSLEVYAELRTRAAGAGAGAGESMGRRALAEVRRRCLGIRRRS